MANQKSSNSIGIRYIKTSNGASRSVKSQLDGRTYEWTIKSTDRIQFSSTYSQTDRQTDKQSASHNS